jgi:RNA polymerase sigma-70 factor (ECF subfamily)
MEDIGSLIKKYRKTGDRKWFSMIYKETMPRIYRYYYYKTMQRELSEDLTSEVFIRVYNNIKNIRLNSKTFISWIYRIAHNLLIDHYRKNNRQNLPLEEVLDSIEVADEELLKKESSYLKKELNLENPELISAIAKLTSLQKDVIILRFMEDMEYDTIARILDKKGGTIRGIVFRAVESLRKEMNMANG